MLDALARLDKQGYWSDEPVRIIDLGSGGGDQLRVVKKWLTQHRIDARLAGLDRSADMLQEAQARLKDPAIQWFEADALHFDYRPYHWVMASLFCHHLRDDALVALIRNILAGGAGLIINDLHRHRLAWAGIRLLTQCLPASYLVRHDGPLSVLRAFKRSDWMRLAHEAGVQRMDVRWSWAFRWQVIIYPHEQPR